MTFNGPVAVTVVVPGANGSKNSPYCVLNGIACV